jgi:hypothetical protein
MSLRDAVGLSFASAGVMTRSELFMTVLVSTACACHQDVAGEDGDAETEVSVFEEDVDSLQALAATTTIGAVYALTPIDCTRYQLTGWACQKGVRQPARVRLVAGGPIDQGGIVLGEVEATLASSEKVSSVCQTSGVGHTFRFLLEKDQLVAVRSKFGPQAPLYVSGFADGAAVQLSGSGRFTTPLVPSGQVRNVKEFGATGNGLDDDSNAIRDALAASAPGDAVFLPPGRYSLHQSLNLGSQVTLCGAGVRRTTLLKRAGSDSGHPLNLSAAREVVVKDLAISVTFPEPKRFHCIRVADSGDRLFFERLSLRGCPFYGIGFQAATGGFTNIFTSVVRISSVGSDGIDFKSASEGANRSIHLLNTCVDDYGLDDDAEVDPSFAGLDLSGSGVVIRGVTIRRTTPVPGFDSRGIRFKSGVRAVDGASVKDFFITGDIDVGISNEKGEARGVKLENGCIDVTGRTSEDISVPSTCTQLTSDFGGNVACRL